MRAGRLSIHLGLPNMSILHTRHQTLQQLIRIQRRFLYEIFHKDALSYILADIKILLLSRPVKKIDDLLIVKFVVGACDYTLRVCHSVDAGEELTEGSLHHAAVVAHHCEGFA